jgi:(1->4)-alpha-D-glucan 1-alpha-D-glucosylmutase
MDVPAPDDWGETRLTLPDAGVYRNVLTGEVVEGGSAELARLLEAFPVALLRRG